VKDQRSGRPTAKPVRHVDHHRSRVVETDHARIGHDANDLERLFAAAALKPLAERLHPRPSGRRSGTSASTLAVNCTGPASLGASEAGTSRGARRPPCRGAVKDDRAPDDRGVGTKPLTPDRVADHHHIRGATPLVVGSQRTPDCGPRLQHVEQLAAGAHEIDLDRITGTGQIRQHGEEFGECVERLRLTPPFLEMAAVHRQHRKTAHELQLHFANRHQLVRLATGERLQQHAR